MSFESSEHAVCRGCGLLLKGKPYHLGGRAYYPETGEEAKRNYYGGYVCSRRCDFRASLELEQSMPGHGITQTRLGGDAKRRLDQNWPEASRG